MANQNQQRCATLAMVLATIVVGSIFMLFGNPFGRPLLAINVTKSLPRGLYIIGSPLALSQGDLAYFELDPQFTDFMRERGYIPSWVKGRYIKPIAAGTGDHVCLQDREVMINGQRVAPVLLEDSQGRKLRPWAGCRKLESGELFVSVLDLNRSFDSRYYGPIDQDQLVGSARPLLVIDRLF